MWIAQRTATPHHSLVFVGGTSEWLELELDGVVGLDELKDQVRAFYRSIMLDRTRRQLGHDIGGRAKAPHMIFQGNPGPQQLQHTVSTPRAPSRDRTLFFFGQIHDHPNH